MCCNHLCPMCVTCYSVQTLRVISTGVNVVIAIFIVVWQRWCTYTGCHCCLIACKDLDNQKEPILSLLIILLWFFFVFYAPRPPHMCLKQISTLMLLTFPQSIPKGYNFDGICTSYYQCKLTMTPTRVNPFCLVLNSVVTDRYL